MILKRANNLIHAAFANFSAYPEIAHGIFVLRKEGGQRSYNRLNIGINGPDSPDTVSANRHSISRSLGGADMVLLKQVHGKSVCIIDKAETVSTLQDSPPEADAAATTQTGVGLVIQSADCQAVMLYDPVRQVVANIHSGWRGSVANIIGSCISSMQDRFGTDPAAVVAAIGPSLGPCCAEFVNYQKELPEFFWKYKDGHHRFNFWQISHDQMIAAGVPASQIEHSCICTKCNPHLFFSYRHAGETGRFAAVIALKKQANGNEND